MHSHRKSGQGMVPEAAKLSFQAHSFPTKRNCKKNVRKISAVLPLFAFLRGAVCANSRPMLDCAKIREGFEDVLSGNRR
jgi:hypothetical protein